jgi:hypothetical protein
MACKYCGKPSRGEYCSFNCAGMDERKHEEAKMKALKKSYAKLHRTPDWKAPKISLAQKRKINRESYALNHPFGF